MVDFDFGKLLRDLRLQSGLTQKQLAARIGVTTSVVSFYELRERTPSPEVLAKLADVFHVSTDYLLGIDKARTIDVSGLDDDDIQLVSLMVQRLREKK